MLVWGLCISALRREDRESASWICRFQWISPALEAAWRPHEFSGEGDGSGLVIDWNDNSELPRYLDERRATKADYLKRIDQIACPNASGSNGNDIRGRARRPQPVFRQLYNFFGEIQARGMAVLPFPMNADAWTKLSKNSSQQLETLD